ncbi:hypothetical protein V6N13_079323 [Hibiscus sabdariffa]
MGWPWCGHHSSISFASSNNVAGNAKGDGRGTQSNMWGSRIREKVFGLVIVYYWYSSYGSVVTVDQDPKTQYPVVVRFNKVNYGNVSTNYALDEIEVK